MGSPSLVAARNGGTMPAWGDCWGGCCAVQGTDRGTSLLDGMMLSQYSIWVGDDSVFDCPEQRSLELN
eukprot:scaffold14824_cov68-Phaeocystis_antarctica.AAC.2